jgi:hypothetical protein
MGCRPSSVQSSLWDGCDSEVREARAQLAFLLVHAGTAALGQVLTFKFSSQIL